MFIPLLSAKQPLAFSTSICLLYQMPERARKLLSNQQYSQLVERLSCSDNPMKIATVIITFEKDIERYQLDFTKLVEHDLVSSELNMLLVRLKRIGAFSSPGLINFLIPYHREEEFIRHFNNYTSKYGEEIQCIEAYLRKSFDLGTSLLSNKKIFSIFKSYIAYINFVRQWLTKGKAFDYRQQANRFIMLLAKIRSNLILWNMIEDRYCGDFYLLPAGFFGLAALEDKDLRQLLILGNNERQKCLVSCLAILLRWMKLGNPNKTVRCKINVLIESLSLCDAEHMESLLKAIKARSKSDTIPKELLDRKNPLGSIEAYLYLLSICPESKELLDITLYLFRKSVPSSTIGSPENKACYDVYVAIFSHSNPLSFAKGFFFLFDLFDCYSSLQVHEEIIKRLSGEQRPDAFSVLFANNLHNDAIFKWGLNNLKESTNFFMAYCCLTEPANSLTATEWGKSVIILHLLQSENPMYLVRIYNIIKSKELPLQNAEAIITWLAEREACFDELYCALIEKNNVDLMQQDLAEIRLFDLTPFIESVPVPMELTAYKTTQVRPDNRQGSTPVETALLEDIEKSLVRKRNGGSSNGYISNASKKHRKTTVTDFFNASNKGRKTTATGFLYNSVSSPMVVGTAAHN